MFCQHCGNQVQDSAAFCPACGQPVDGGGAPSAGQAPEYQPPQPQQAQPQPQQPQVNYAGNTAPAAQPQAAPAAKKRNVAVIAIVAVAVVAVAAIVAFMMVSGGDNSNSGDNGSASAPSSTGEYSSSSSEYASSSGEYASSSGGYSSSSANTSQGQTVDKAALTGDVWETSYEGNYTEYTKYYDDGTMCQVEDYGTGVSCWFGTYRVSGDEIVIDMLSSPLNGGTVIKTTWQNGRPVHEIVQDPDNSYLQDAYAASKGDRSAIKIISEYQKMAYEYVGTWPTPTTAHINNDGTWRAGNNSGIWLFASGTVNNASYGNGAIMLVSSSGDTMVYTLKNGALVSAM